MLYVSTRDRDRHTNASTAIVRGLAPDGGLFAPQRISGCDGFWETLMDKSYAQRAASVLASFLDDFSMDELDEYARLAYESGHFDDCGPAPVRTLPNGLSILELMHGPTAAFKDMALQMLPHLLTASLRKCGEEREVFVLTATSGDTGKAALEGFRDVPGTRVLVFYPKDGVSNIQERQMVTQQGGNVGVCAVHGNFDDTQTGVKKLFRDKALAEEMNSLGLFFSSANSINLGRLAPQVAYYFSAYCDMVGQGSIPPGAPIPICVPTGNFGNILSALYAWEMGLPMSKLLCASNRNDVLTDFLNSGTYDRRRPFHRTYSPSMDILVSSNLERALFLLSDGSDDLARKCMADLNGIGRYTVPHALKRAFDRRFYAGSGDDEQTLETIAALWTESGYLADPHTAVAVRVAEDYRRETGDLTPMLVVSTASPYKFCAPVLEALGAKAGNEGDALIERLFDLTGWPVPEGLQGLSGRTVRFTEVVNPEDMRQCVISYAQPAEPGVVG